MAIANTKDNRAELEKKIYDSKKGILDSEVTELNNEKELGQIQEGSLSYLHRLKEIRSDIQKSDLNRIDKQKELLSIDEDINSARQAYNENQINAVDHLVNIGKLQANSLEYVQRLNYLYRHLNLTLEERKSLQEKIFSAEKSYISQLESDLSDESIVGSYGYRIKQIQDQIDAINNQSDAESKALAVEKAKAAWEEAQNNKTVQIYRNGKGFVYETDQSAVKGKKEAYSDAQREEQIEKLNQQKNAIQTEEDSMKSKLENTLKTLEGTNNQSWSNIQEQVEDVLTDVNKWVSKSTRSTIFAYSEQDDALNESTENTQEDYDEQIESAKGFIKKFTPITQQITALNNIIASSFDKATASVTAWGQALLQAETDRENANWHYYEYNKELKENHESVRYASGTEDSVGGIVKKNEQGYELTFEPTDNGNYEILKEHSKVLTAPQTQRIFDLAKGVSPQIATLKANLNLGKVGGNISNRTTKTDITNKYEIKKIEFPNATNKDEIQAAFGSLDLYFKQKAFSNE